MVMYDGCYGDSDDAGLDDGKNGAEGKSLMMVVTVCW